MAPSQRTIIPRLPVNDSHVYWTGLKCNLDSAALPDNEKVETSITGCVRYDDASYPNRRKIADQNVGLNKQHFFVRSLLNSHRQSIAPAVADRCHVRSCTLIRLKWSFQQRYSGTRKLPIRLSSPCLTELHSSVFQPSNVPVF